MKVNYESYLALYLDKVARWRTAKVCDSVVTGSSHTRTAVE